MVMQRELAVDKRTGMKLPGIETVTIGTPRRIADEIASPWLHFGSGQAAQSGLEVIDKGGFRGAHDGHPIFADLKAAGAMVAAKLLVLLHGPTRGGQRATREFLANERLGKPSGR